MLLASGAAAAATPALRIRGAGPANTSLIYRISPGAIMQGTVVVINDGKAAVPTVRLFTADAITGRASGPVYVTNRRPRQAGAWISLSQHSISLAAGERRRIRFTIRVPRNAPSGESVAGIVVELRGATHELAAVAVQIDVPGWKSSSFLSGLSPSRPRAEPSSWSFRFGTTATWCADHMGQ